MDTTISLGPNRTGIKASPNDAPELIEQSKYQLDVPQPTPDGDDIRAEYAREADPVGSMPPPASVKGVVGSIAATIGGKRMHLLIDKLGERAAYERTGTRIYDAAIRKVTVLAAEGTPLPGGLTVEDLTSIRNDEVAHFAMLCKAIESLGGDPTSLTPCADMTGVQGMGLVQAINEPRATLAQTLQTLLAAEVIDVASWELLIELAAGFNQDALVQQFQEALMAETLHERQVTKWLRAALTEQALGEDATGEEAQA